MKGRENIPEEMTVDPESGNVSKLGQTGKRVRKRKESLQADAPVRRVTGE